MTKKRWLVATAILVCLPILIIAFLTLRTDVNKANFDRVEVGMTFAEVKEIFGKQPLDKGSRPGVPFVFFWGDREETGAILDFGENEKVVQKQWIDRTFWDRISDKFP